MVSSYDLRVSGQTSRKPPVAPRGWVRHPRGPSTIAPPALRMGQPPSLDCEPWEGGVGAAVTTVSPALPSTELGTEQGPRV